MANGASSTTVVVAVSGESVKTWSSLADLLRSVAYQVCVSENVVFELASERSFRTVKRCRIVSARAVEMPSE
eukprot:2021624-Rhodomonas_salina.1